MRKLLLSLVFVLPVAALALDYSDLTMRYKDAPFSQPETAAISLLTRIEAVEGNPDGFFYAGRTLNRAEFMKIVWMSMPAGDGADDVNRNCFPDVRMGQWFSAYICPMKDLGIVGGYPDGRFYPERSVNYAEALKILTLAFGYDIEPPQESGELWYLPYAHAAQEHGTTIPASLTLDTEITRGQMARLAAAFYAESHGDLQNYRRAERGLPPQSSASSLSSSPSSSSSVSSTSSFSSSSLSSSVLAHDFPARSRFLVAGERSQPIASATFFANLEPMIVRRAEVKLENEIEGIDAMFIVDRDGVELGQIFLDKIFDPTEKTWRGALTGNYRIDKAEQKVIGIEIRMKERNQGGTSEEMVQVDTFRLTVDGEWTTNTTTATADVNQWPKHQTSMGRITSVTNAQEESGVLPLGASSQLASFRIRGTAINPVTLKIEHLTFSVSKPNTVSISNWQLGIADSTERWPCSFNEADSAVSCSSLSDAIGTLSGGDRTFRLFGDVTLLPSTNKAVQISLVLAGDLATAGAVRWTDGTGHFNWVELDQPLARSTRWE